MRLILPAMLVAGCAVYGLPVTGGSLEFGNGNPRFAISGDGWAATNPWYGPGNFYILGCSPCVPGFVLSVRGHAGGNDLRIGTATVDGVTTPVSWGSPNAPMSVVNFDGPPIPILGAGVYTTPFNFTGRLCGVTPTTPFGQCFVDFDNLVGSGTVTVNIIPLFDNLLGMESAVYAFSAPLPTTSNPEPGTWALMVGGLAAAWMLRLRSGRKSWS